MGPAPEQLYLAKEDRSVEMKQILQETTPMYWIETCNDNAFETTPRQYPMMASYDIIMLIIIFSPCVVSVQYFCTVPWVFCISC